MSGILTPTFLNTLQENMQLISENAYASLNDSLWWQHVAKVRPSKTKVEQLTWLLNTAKIEWTEAGQVKFRDMAMRQHEVTNRTAGAGLRLLREELEDLDGTGVDQAATWARDVGEYAAYWPQKTLAAAIKANGTCYDGQAFFSAAHPVNPFIENSGTYANLFTGSASPGVTPGALPIDESVTVDVAIKNLSLAQSYIASIRMPNGEDPRNLVVDKILVPPALMARATQITNATMIPQMAGTGAGGSANIDAVVRMLGLAQPIKAPELGVNFGGSDTAYYLLAREIQSNDLGAFVYVDREEFHVNYHTPQTSAELSRTDAFEWVMRGRNSVSTGHPYLMFKVS